MVRVFAAQIVDMQRDQGVIDEALEKLASQVHIELADVRARERNMVVQAWTAGKIDDDARQCFVQRHIRMAVAAQSGLVAHGCGKSLAQGNAHVRSEGSRGGKE